MSPNSPSPQRADARRNRERILAAARAEFTEHRGGSVSMAQIARRAGVGMATLYRNYPARRDLLEAVFTEPVDEICARADDPAATTGEALFGWLQRFFDFAHQRNDVATELIAETGLNTAVFHDDRRRLCAAGEPLLRSAQRDGACGSTLDIGQILDALVHLGRIGGGRAHVQPIVDTFFRGLAHPERQAEPERTAGPERRARGRARRA